METSAISDDPPLTSQLSSSWAGALEEVQKTLITAGQTLYDGGADLAAKSRQVMSSTMSGYGSITQPIEHNSIMELPPMGCTREIGFVPKMDCAFVRSSSGELNELIFVLDLPAFERKDVEVLVDDGVLSFSGERSQSDFLNIAGILSEVSFVRRESDTEAKHTSPVVTEIIKERNSGYFHRSFKLPPNALEEDITAGMEKGVLEVRVKCKLHHVGVVVVNLESHTAQD
eukprot:GHVQ01020862.1.p1 GENE.GHVQ01020862.1~~GHVQ01020862.1.p1  ORF type:complete len:229 (+),score=39.05 GHVQ01020862.1:486-1172(+)